MQHVFASAVAWHGRVLNAGGVNNVFASAVAWHGRVLNAGSVNNEDTLTSVIEHNFFLAMSGQNNLIIST